MTSKCQKTPLNNCLARRLSCICFFISRLPASFFYWLSTVSVVLTLFIGPKVNNEWDLFEKTFIIFLYLCFFYISASCHLWQTVNGTSGKKNFMRYLYQIKFGAKFSRNIKGEISRILKYSSVRCKKVKYNRNNT